MPSFVDGILVGAWLLTQYTNTTVLKINPQARPL
jgi:hypothetical protein